MPDLTFELHDKQLEVFNDGAKNKVIAAGRRSGKSFLAAVLLLIYGLMDKNKEGYNVALKEVWYIAPTFQQGKDIMWGLLKSLGKYGEEDTVIASTIENTATIRLINGRTIKIKGSDRPDTLRGPGLSFVVLDEYADMKPEVWEEIVQPTLMEVDGDAFFIGSPKGKNHFYEVWKMAGSGIDEWASFHFTSRDNPHIPKHVLDKKIKTMSAQSIRQELDASFEAAGGGAFLEEHVKYADESPEPGTIFISVDLAGFGTGGSMIKSAIAKLDETSISVVEVSTKGWFVHDIIHGRWDIRETALRIIKAAKNYQPACLGIEAGALKNAVMPYLSDEMKRVNIFPHIEPVSHGGKKKTDRIIWALQGRLERGRLILREASWNKAFVDQLLDFPNPMAHDDLLDSLAYIDQVATTSYAQFIDFEEFKPLDAWSGI